MVSALGRLPGLTLMPYPDGEKANYQYVIVEVDGALSRDQLIAVLHDENVLARKYFYPGCHRMEPYRSLFPDAGRLLPETERLAQRVLSLPNGNSIGEAEVNGICGLIRFAIDNGAAVRRGLKASPPC